MRRHLGKKLEISIRDMSGGPYSRKRSITIPPSLIHTDAMRPFCFLPPCPHRLPASHRPRKRQRAPRAALSRREALQVLTGGSALLSRGARPDESTVFLVRPESEARVVLEAVPWTDAIAELSGAGAVLAGVNHGSVRDHILAARVLDDIARARPTAVAVEAVERRFQGALNDYMRGALSEEGLYFASQWETRRGWPYEATLPLLRAARARAASALALAADAEVLARVRAPGGLRNLSASELHTLVADPDGFAAMSREDAFRAYVRECVTPSYAAHARLGLLSPQANFEKFYTARVVADEAMAAACMRFVDKHPDATLLAVMGKEHVKFGYGVALRLKRLLRGRSNVRSILLNPRAEDAYDVQAGALKLEIRDGHSSLLIADYLWFSSPGDVGYKRSSRRLWNLPPVEQLVLPETVVSNTGSGI